MGLLQTLCEVTKSGPPELIQEQLSLALDVGRSVDGIPSLVNNTVIRKFKTKIVARAALRLLPAKRNLRKGEVYLPRLNLKLIITAGRVLVAGDSAETSESENEEDAQVPEEIENILENLFSALQDKVKFVDSGCLS